MSGLRSENLEVMLTVRNGVPTFSSHTLGLVTLFVLPFFVPMINFQQDLIVELYHLRHRFTRSHPLSRKIYNKHVTMCVFCLETVVNASRGSGKDAGRRLRVCFISAPWWGESYLLSRSGVRKLPCEIDRLKGSLKASSESSIFLSKVDTILHRPSSNSFIHLKPLLFYF